MGEIAEFSKKKFLSDGEKFYKKSFLLRNLIIYTAMKKITIILPLLLLTMQAQANVVLLSDTFDRVTGKGDGNTSNTPAYTDGNSNWGANDNALGGTVVQTYTATNSAARTGGLQQVTGVPFVGTVQQTAIGSVATLGSGSAKTTTSFMPAYNTVVGATGLIISFSFDRFTDPAATAANGFIAMGIGTDAGGATVVPGVVTEAQDNSDWALGFQQGTTTNPNGNAQTFDGTSATALTNFNYGNTSTSPLELHRVRITLTPNGDFNTAGTTVNYDINVDGTSRSTGSFTTSGGDFGILTFSSNQSVTRYIDNLVVEAITIPEPSTALLGLIGAVGLLRRRRVS